MKLITKVIITRQLGCTKLNSLRYSNAFQSRASSTNIYYQKYDTLIKNIQDNFKKCVLFYEDISGTTEINKAQDKLAELEKGMVTSKTKSELAMVELEGIREQLKRILLLIEPLGRDDDKYLDMVKEENRLYREEKSCKKKLVLLEEEEDFHLSTFSSVLREVNEKEKFHTTRRNYWYLICSVVGVMAGLIAKLRRDHKLMPDIKQLANKSLGLNTDSQWLEAVDSLRQEQLSLDTLKVIQNVAIKNMELENSKLKLELEKLESRVSTKVGVVVGVSLVVPYICYIIVHNYF